MTTESPTAQSGPSAENASWNDAYERARKIIHDHCPNGHWITGWNTLAMALASEFETPPAGARDAVTDDGVANLLEAIADNRGLNVIRQLAEKVKASQPAASGAGEGRVTPEMWSALDEANALVADVESRREARMQKLPSTAATGMGDAEWTDDQCIAFMGRALRHVDLVGEEGPSCDEIRQGVKAALTSKADGEKK